MVSISLLCNHRFLLHNPKLVYLSNFPKMSRYYSRLKEFRIHLCQKGASSKGVREFIEQHYVPYKQANPTLPILIRECSGVQPKLWARYDKGEEKCTPLNDLSASEVLSKIKSLEK